MDAVRLAKKWEEVSSGEARKESRKKPPLKRNWTAHEERNGKLGDTREGGKVR